MYRSAFSRWDDRASVRVKPRRNLGEGGELYFPPEMVPSAAHPAVVALGPAAVGELMVLRLYEYLHFTTELEAVAVIPVTATIATGRSGVELPERMRADAFAITTDEAWHAQFSDDMAGQVRERTGVDRPPFAPPAFLTRLAAIKAGLDPALHRAADLAFAVVSETLISGLLVDLPRDARLPAPVRALVQDHAEDEGRHHAYFRQFLRHFWPALSASERRGIGPLVPEMITAFLEPERDPTPLVHIGLPRRVAEEVVADTRRPEETRAAIALAAQATVRYFAEEGALTDPRTRDAFDAAGMGPGHLTVLADSLP